MFTVTILAAPKRADLTQSLVEDLRGQWQGGHVIWLNPGIAAEFPIKSIPVLAKPQHNQDQYVLKVSHGLHLLLLTVQWAKLTEPAGMTPGPRFRPDIGAFSPIPDIFRLYRASLVRWTCKFGGPGGGFGGPGGLALWVVGDLPRAHPCRSQTGKCLF